MGYISDYLNASEFLFTSPSQADILDGKNEGMYAWIGTNYLLNKFSRVS